MASGVIRVPNVSAESVIMRKVPNSSTSRCCDGVGSEQTTRQKHCRCWSASFWAAMPKSVFSFSAPKMPPGSLERNF